MSTDEMIILSNIAVSIPTIVLSIATVREAKMMVGIVKILIDLVYTLSGGRPAKITYVSKHSTKAIKVASGGGKHEN